MDSMHTLPHSISHSPPHPLQDPSREFLDKFCAIPLPDLPPEEALEKVKALVASSDVQASGGNE